MIQTKFKVSGLAEARAVLKQLPDRVQRRVLASSVRASATEMNRAIKRAVPRNKEGTSKAAEKYGHLHENVRMIRLRRVPKGSAAYRVDTGNAFWGYMLEFGTGRFHQGPGTFSKGAGAQTHIPARPWFRPAVDTAAEAALARMRERLAKGLEREANALAGPYVKAKGRLR